jgi:hypothetical protein
MYPLNGKCSRLPDSGPGEHEHLLNHHRLIGQAGIQGFANLLEVCVEVEPSEIGRVLEAAAPFA